MSTQFKFLPYGLPAVKMQQLFEVKVPVLDWLPLDVKRQESWDNFLEETMGIVNRTLWPKWDPTKGEWTSGGVTHKEMSFLTEADFEVLDRMPLKHRGLDFKPDLPSIDPACPVHRKFFEQEDDRNSNEPVGFSYAMYDTSAPPEIKTNFAQWWSEGMRAKEGSPTSVSMQFKVLLQRPRAFQIALLQKRLNYVHEFAFTGFTPAMSSGHALQGLIGTGGVMEQALARNLPATLLSWRALRQFAVDIGDRRVMAGIHYPSDSLCSWIIALKLARGVFRHQEVAVHLWTAITEQSVVHKAIVASGNPAYDPALTELQKLRP